MSLEKNRIIIIFSIIVFFTTLTIRSHAAIIYITSIDVGKQQKVTQKDIFRIVFYNVENFFDTICSKDYIAFSREGSYHWTKNRYYKKLNNISKAMYNCGNFDAPDMIGVCEVESKQVLEDLCKKTILNKFSYRYLHIEDRDPRGIEVALLYKPDVFNLISYEYIDLSIDTSVYIARRALLAKFCLDSSDTIAILVNHWPSRYSGLNRTQEKRNSAAKVIKSVCRELLSDLRYLVIMGDFNDEPDSESLLEITGTKSDTIYYPENKYIYNSFLFNPKPNKGSIKRKGRWYYFDQILFSSPFISNSSLTIKNSKAKLVEECFLLEEDPKYPGYRPSRTYNGMRYNGGYSDHLPVYIDIIRTKE
ncbi:MAG: hypothetical protein ACEPOV_08360 [Hyphomicrobiales bacterium]